MHALTRTAQSTHRGLQKEAAWALGSVAGTPGRAGSDAVLAAGGVPVLKRLLLTGGYDVRKEAVFALANICAGEASQYSLLGALWELRLLVSCKLLRV